jgi:hypothetical protein
MCHDYKHGQIKKNEHFRFLIFETLSHRSVPNILRDLQKINKLDDQLVHMNCTAIKYLSPIMSVSGPSNYAGPFLRFLGPETDTFCHFLISLKWVSIINFTHSIQCITMPAWNNPGF